jgi:ATP-dependent Lon protease
MHALRSEILYGAIVDEVLDVPKSAGARDTKSIKRICSALLKLYFPHVRDTSDLNKDEFNRYCLEPAKQMRRIIRKQLHIINPGEYVDNIPDIQYKY